MRARAVENDPDRSVTVHARVVRFGDDGVGLELVPPVDDVILGPHTRVVNGANRNAFRRFLLRLQEDRI